MKKAMLDTDILSAFFRGNKEVETKTRLYVQEYGSLNISIITYYEVLNGLLYRDSQKLLGKFKEFCLENNVLPLSIPSVDVSASIEAKLRKDGTPIGHTDVLIAGIAIANHMQLISNNTSHFSRIKELDLANWMSKTPQIPDPPL